MVGKLHLDVATSAAVAVAVPMVKIIATVEFAADLAMVQVVVEDKDFKVQNEDVATEALRLLLVLMVAVGILGVVTQGLQEP